MKDTLIRRKINQLVQYNRKKRLHNLIGQWTGKKMKVVSTQGENKSEILELKHKLDISTDLAFTWKLCKLGMVKFKDNYTNLVFQSQQALGLSKGDWEIKKLTFNKLIILQKTEDNQQLEFHFRKSFEGYHEG